MLLYQNRGWVVYSLEVKSESLGRPMRSQNKCMQEVESMWQDRKSENEEGSVLLHHHNPLGNQPGSHQSCTNSFWKQHPQWPNDFQLTPIFYRFPLLPHHHIEHQTSSRQTFGDTLKNLKYSKHFQGKKVWRQQTKDLVNQKILKIINLKMKWHILLPFKIF